MLNRPQHPQHTAAKRCASCGGKFGLVRHYSWRSQLCSRKCVDRFKIERESARKWLHPFRAAWV